MDKKYITTSAKQTQKIGQDLAKEIVGFGFKNQAVVLGLHGNLGGGKTTFLQGFARGLGIKEKILSPTFIIYRKSQSPNFKYFYHFDCYRLKNEKDILELGFEDIIKNPQNIVAIEWAEKIEKALPKKIISINFEFINKNKREILIENPMPAK